MNDIPLKIGTRGSPLALAQAHEVKRRLISHHPELASEPMIEIVVIRTSGDRNRFGPLRDIGGKGLFTKEIEEALAQGVIDIAVHSMKDVPTLLPDGLTIDCFLPREDPRDALICRQARRLDDLPPGTVVGTASLRRQAILLHRRPDLTVIPIRGNVDTRIERLGRGEVDATFLAVAGLKRLGRTDIDATPVETAEMLPAACQGIIGIERRADDHHTRMLLEPLNDPQTMTCAISERTVLEGLDGSCRTPIAALATLTDSKLALQCAIVRPDGSSYLETERIGAPAEVVSMASDAASELRGRGGPDFFDG